MPAGKPASRIKRASFRADSGVSSEGLMIRQFPVARAGASFQIVIILWNWVVSWVDGLRMGGYGEGIQRRIPGYNGGTDTQWLAESVPHSAVGEMQRLAVDLVGPAGIVAKGGDGLGHAHVHAVGVEEPTLQGFKGCQVLRVALDQIGEFVQEGAADGARGGFPCGEGLCGAVHGAVDVRWAGGGDGCEWGAGGRVLDGQGLGGGGRGEFIVDEEGGGDWWC